MGERLGEIYWIKMSFQQSFKTNHRFSSPDEESFPKLRMLQAQMGDYIWLYGKKVEQLQDLDQMMWDLGCTNRVSVALIYKQGPVSGALRVNNRILKQILKFTGSQWREKRIDVSAGSFLLTSFLLCSATAGYGLWRTKRCTWKHENSNQRRRKLKFKMTEWQQQFDFSNIFLDEGKKIGSAKRCRCVQNADVGQRWYQRSYQVICSYQRGLMYWLIALEEILCQTQEWVLLELTIQLLRLVGFTEKYTCVSSTVHCNDQGFFWNCWVDGPGITHI